MYNLNFIYFTLILIHFSICAHYCIILVCFSFTSIYLTSWKSYFPLTTRNIACVWYSIWSEISPGTLQPCHDRPLDRRRIAAVCPWQVGSTTVWCPALMKSFIWKISKKMPLFYPKYLPGHGHYDETTRKRDSPEP